MGQLLHFPTKPSNVTSITATRPLGPDAAVYWFCAGEIVFRAGPRVLVLTEAEAFERRAFWQARANEAFVERAMREARHAAKMWAELTRALDSLDLYRRATKGRGLDWPEDEAADRLRFSVTVGDDGPEAA